MHILGMLSIYSQFMKSIGQFSDLFFFTHVVGQLYQVIHFVLYEMFAISVAFDYVKCSKNYQE